MGHDLPSKCCLDRWTLSLSVNAGSEYFLSFTVRNSMQTSIAKICASYHIQCLPVELHLNYYSGFNLKKSIINY